MIITVTLNPALDVTYTVPGLAVDATNRVRAVAMRPGGKGVNVAGVINSLLADGIDAPEVTVLAFAGGHQGELFTEMLRRRGIAHDLVTTRGETRRTLALVDPANGTVTSLSEPGPVINEHEWGEMRDRVRALMPRATVLVLSGSLPPGVPSGAYAVLVRLARGFGVPVVVDAGGEALRRALKERPDLVKPNAAELASVVGPSVLALDRSETEEKSGVKRKRDLADRNENGWLQTAAFQLRTAGAGVVIASDGPRGLWADTPRGQWHAVPPHVPSGNPTGAGDAVAAALALGLARVWDHSSPAGQVVDLSSWNWPHMLTHAAALSAAAVHAPLAGEVDPAVYRANLAQVVVTPTPTHPLGKDE
ncbi:tagatose 6-phosphate kinase [Sinosporangium album]|uniref:Tagatose 6-phosphate kinase n=1 Tax=Sinosporangium album TaxID=504805 RepID=A0A1G7S6Y5_9ACTN|nr:hexose kinase [Sinosporangium album]SDG18785.1 tagatose 6-phosphate kinase [Sinosporangium album]